ncbi:MAG: pyridoxine 5'-phosphate synthase [Planctomycetes bacterium]|nr:pyridoxine 5'-phosphate synthase [Planctomycetota bacterium]
MAQLNVNIDHVATIRQARMVDEPDPVWAAVECELGGASGITMHLREDRRHVQDRDVKLVGEVAGVKLNLEMALTEPMVRFAVKLKPDQVTLVPEKRQELTTEGGLDCVKLQKRLTAATRRLQKAGIVVATFIVPAEAQIAASAKAGCEAVELHTGMYANARNERQVAKRLRDLELARDFGWDQGLSIHAGHGLNYRNISGVARIEGLEDFNIGHSIVARSVFVGMRQATCEMIALIDKFSTQFAEF